MEPTAYTCYIASVLRYNELTSSDTQPTVAAAVKQMLERTKPIGQYEGATILLTTIQTRLVDGVPTVGSYIVRYEKKDLAWMTVEATPLISDVVPANTEVLAPPDTTEVYMVVCASDTLLTEGPGPNYRELLDDLTESNDYQGFTDQPIILSFKGTAQQIAILVENIEISGWVDDPDNYDDDDDDENDNDDDEGDDEDEDEDDDIDGDPTFGELTE